MMSEHFEVAIIGQQLPGLLLATELARAGRRVVVLQTQEEATVAPSPALDPTAFAHVLETLEAHVPHLRGAHQAMGLSQLTTLAAATSQPPPACRAQIIFPHGRITLPSAAAPRRAEAAASPGDRSQPADARGAEAMAESVAVEARLVAELAAEFPASRAGAASWAAAITAAGARLGPLMAGCRSGPPQGMWARWRARDLGAQLLPWGQRACASSLVPSATDVVLWRLATGLLPFVTGRAPLSASRLQTARIWGRLLAGGPLAAEVGAAEALAPNFLAAARQAGAQVPAGQPLVRLHGSARRLRLCDLEGRRGQMGADFFVLNCAGSLPAALFTTPSGPRLQRAFGRTPPDSGHLGRLSLQVAADCVPASLAPVAILLNGRDRRSPDSPADPPLCLRQLPGPQGSVTLVVDCPLSGPGDVVTASEVTAQQASRATALAHIMPRLGRLLPYVSPQARLATWARGGRPIRTHSDPIAAGGHWQSLQARGQKTPVDNLLDGRGEVMVGLGLEGAYLLAQLTASTLRRAAGGAWQRHRDRPVD